MTQRSADTTDVGASVIEYALLIALIAMVCLASLQLFGSNRNNSLSRSGSAIVREP